MGNDGTTGWEGREGGGGATSVSFSSPPLLHLASHFYVLHVMEM